VTKPAIPEPTIATFCFALLFVNAILMMLSRYRCKTVYKRVTGLPISMVINGGAKPCTAKLNETGPRPWFHRKKNSLMAELCEISGNGEPKDCTRSKFVRDCTHVANFRQTRISSLSKNCIISNQVKSMFVPGVHAITASQQSTISVAETEKGPNNVQSKVHGLVHSSSIMRRYHIQKTRLPRYFC